MKKLGWRASDTRELAFESCAVPEGNLLGERGAGFRQFLEILDSGRISVAAMGVGLAQGAYDLACAYSKEREPSFEPTDVNAVVRDVVELVQAQAAERGVEVALRLDEALPAVLADAEGVHRALLNVVGNALDALEEVEERRLQIATLREPAEGGKSWVRVVVRDSGPGIAPELLERVFEPLFTTKARGSGLGLAISAGIAQAHGARLRAGNRPTGGAVFTVEFPPAALAPAVVA